MTSDPQKTSGPSRRQIAKGAAWAVPAVSVAATAPSLAASPVPSDCDCITSAERNVTVTVFRQGTPTGVAQLQGGLNLNMSGCAPLASPTATLVSATLTFSRASGAPSSYTTSLNRSLDASTPGSVTVVQPINFTGVVIPDGTYSGAPESNPAWPSGVCFEISFTRLVNGVETPCTQVVCRAPTGGTAAATMPGTVNFQSTWA